MSVLNTALTAVVILVVVYVLLRPGNQSATVIHALGSTSSDLTRTLTGQYAGGQY